MLFLTQGKLLKKIETQFLGTFDFFHFQLTEVVKISHLPRNQPVRRTGYLVVNFIEPWNIISFYKSFHDKKWRVDADKMSVTYAAIQVRPLTPAWRNAPS